MSFRNILIANRGEIACRIISSAREKGYRTIAIYSAADSLSPHVSRADKAVYVGDSNIKDSYLNIEAILEASRISGAEAVHPGYGFLSENPDFARACVKEGLKFIGPSADAIEVMGNKRLAKVLIQRAGIPCVPGYSGEDQTPDRLNKEAHAIGFPIMIKAAAGGGGRGLRLVEAPDDFASTLITAISEARNAFGSEEVILEKALFNARHIEIQIFADDLGNYVHLGERDCSIQRRHQKIVEEAPSPALDERLRREMGEAAITVAKTIRYSGAGTVEFLLSENREFYFLEMNTRLQVEHPVTELITCLDLVGLQLDIAQGDTLPFEQKTVTFNGHAIEARLYAEDPKSGFLPQTGKIIAWEPGSRIRVDSGIESGQIITSFYDPMVAKVIAHGKDREEARRKLIRGLEKTTFIGVKNNKSFLIDILNHPTFIMGSATTTFLSTFLSQNSFDSRGIESKVLCFAASLLHNLTSEPSLGWQTATSARTVMDLRYEDHKASVNMLIDNNNYALSVDGGELFNIELRLISDRKATVVYGSLRETLDFLFDENVLHLNFEGRTLGFWEYTPEIGASNHPVGDNNLIAPMAGRIVRIGASRGEKIDEGVIVIILEAMKMEHEIKTTRKSTIEGIHVQEGDQVEARQILMTVEPATN